MYQSLSKAEDLDVQGRREPAPLSYLSVRVVFTAPATPPHHFPIYLSVGASYHLHETGRADLKICFVLTLEKSRGFPKPDSL